VRELVDVQHVHAAQLGDLVQIEVVGDDLALERARHLDQLQVDLPHVRKVEIGNHHLDARHLLNLLQDVEAAAPAVALERIGGVGDELQLFQDELRNDERAVDEAGLAHVGDAAVDDDAGVEHLVAPFGTGRPEQARQPRRLEPFAVLAADHEAEIRQHDQRKAVQELDAPIAAVGPEQARHDQMGDAETDRAPDQRAEDTRDCGFAKPCFDGNDEAGERESEGDVRDETDRKRLQDRGGVGDGSDEQHAGERKPGHGATPDRNARLAMKDGKTTGGTAFGRHTIPPETIGDNYREQAAVARRARLQAGPLRTGVGGGRSRQAAAADGPPRAFQASAASSASPTVRTPTSSQLPSTPVEREPSRPPERELFWRASGSMFASGMMHRRKPICAASRTRSAAWVMPRTSPARPTSPNIAVVDGIARFRTLDAIAARTPRSDAGSSTVIPPATFTKTSSPMRLSPARFSRTASSSDRRCESMPLAIRRAVPYVLELTRACTSTRIGREPSTEHST